LLLAVVALLDLHYLVLVLVQLRMVVELVLPELLLASLVLAGFLLL